MSRVTVLEAGVKGSRVAITRVHTAAMADGYAELNITGIAKRYS